MRSATSASNDDTAFARNCENYALLEEGIEQSKAS